MQTKAQREVEHAIDIVKRVRKDNGDVPDEQLITWLRVASVGLAYAANLMDESKSDEFKQPLRVCQLCGHEYWNER